MALGLVCTFIVGDVLLARLRLPPVSGSRNECRRKWERLAGSATIPDVAFLGCSFEWCGIRPATIDREVARQTGRSITSVNLAAAQASLVTQFLVVRRMIDSDRLPGLVYLGVSPIAADDGEYDWLAAGLTALGDRRDLPLSASVGPRLFLDTLARSLFTGVHQWSDCRQIARRSAIGARLEADAVGGRDERGWRALPVKPAGGRTLAPHPRSRFGATASAIRFDNANGRSLRRAIALLRSRGVVVRLIEMPLASTISPEHDPGKNEAYQRFLAQIVADTAVVVVRVGRDFVSDADFVDGGHLHRDGAEKLSRWLAGDVARSLRAADPHVGDARRDAGDRSG
jgi:hypothetical protein